MFRTTLRRAALRRTYATARPQPRKPIAAAIPHPAPPRSLHYLTLAAALLGASAGAYTFATTNAPLHAEAPVAAPGVPVPLDPTATGVELIPSGTTSVPPFPRTLTPPGGGGEYALVGLGIRTVSFLSIQVYVAGLYVHVDDLAAVQQALVKRVAGAGASAVAGPEEQEAMRKLLAEGGDEVWGALLDQTKFRSCFRVVPTRNTDFGHLRDGWVRGIQARTSLGGEYEDDGVFAESMNVFKKVFTGGSVAKQKTLLLMRGPEGLLELWYDKTGRNDGGFGGEGEEQARRLGEVRDRRVAKALWLCYLSGKKVASESLRESIIDGVMGMASRPAGTLGVTHV
ncbi:chalcone-flavanone isomerase-domain-containing protein [Geopyxis carbonaria]|nr:chalcone-flavanone isomerase-domain-containing protein [Geopyxis carbonaria]